MFSIGEYLGVSDATATIIIAFVIGAVGVIYLFIGGLSLSAFSDSIYGVGLIIGGLIITILGLHHLGDGNFVKGFDHMVQRTPEKLNALGPLIQMLFHGQHYSLVCSLIIYSFGVRTK